MSPLSGVVTPFLNYGKSSTIVNFIVLGILASISAHPGPPGQNEMFRKPVRWVGGVLAALAAAVLLQAARIQIVNSDNFMVAGILGVQADGHRRYSYNPRILEAARQIDRGSIFDRNGIPLAVSSRGRWNLAERNSRSLGSCWRKPWIRTPAGSTHSEG